MKNQNEEDKDDSIIEEMDFNNPSFMYKPEANHGWKARGPYLVCTECIVEHGAWIGVNKLLVGFTEKGEPILKNKDEYFKS